MTPGIQINRREFLLSTGLGVLAVSMLPTATRAGWQDVSEILARIHAPVFPDRDFDITRYGAVGNGSTDCSKAITSAIQECSRAGGGRVVVPKGDFLTGAVHLQSNVNLHLSEGATLRFIPDPERYLPAVYTRWEGVECFSYSSFIYAFEQTNIAVTGSGTLDGQANNEHWWPWAGSPAFGGSREGSNQVAARSRLFLM
jgi:polygalacturonase